MPDQNARFTCLPAEDVRLRTMRPSMAPPLTVTVSMSGSFTVAQDGAEVGEKAVCGDFDATLDLFVGAAAA
jgi:hypothetical protein